MTRAGRPHTSAPRRDPLHGRDLKEWRVSVHAAAGQHDGGSCPAGSGRQPAHHPHTSGKLTHAKYHALPGRAFQYGAALRVWPRPRRPAAYAAPHRRRPHPPSAPITVWYGKDAPPQVRLYAQDSITTTTEPVPAADMPCITPVRAFSTCLFPASPRSCAKTSAAWASPVAPSG